MCNTDPVGSRNLPLAAAVIMFTIAAAGATLRAADDNAALIQKGRALYARHCASCHGVQAGGDGPAATSLKIAPADLTRIGKKYSGYPAEKMSDYIDGTKFAIGHGSREMPIWGKQFRKGKSAGVPDEILSLNKYLESIQAK